MTDKLEPTLARTAEALAPTLGGKNGAGKTLDARALKILFKTFWTSAGWRDTPDTPPGDLAYAIAAGTMFAARNLSHDELVADLARVCRLLTPRDVGAAFVASLGSRRLDLRSALGTYAIWRHLPAHLKTPASAALCDQCPCRDYHHQHHHALSGLNFERHKWGGVRHLDPVYAWVDLTALDAAARPTPTADDYAILRATLHAACDAQLGARPGVLEKALAPIVKSNLAERQVLIQLLAYAGILDCTPHPSFLHGFVPAHLQACPGNEWGFPAGWWRGTGAVNLDAVAYFFGEAALE